MVEAISSMEILMILVYLSIGVLSTIMIFFIELLLYGDIILNSRKTTVYTKPANQTKNVSILKI